VTIGAMARAVAVVENREGVARATANAVARGATESPAAAARAGVARATRIARMLALARPRQIDPNGAASGASAEAEDADAPLVHVRSEIVEGSGGSSGIPAVRLRIMDPAALQQLQSSLEAQRAAAGAKRVLHIPRQRLPSAGHRRPLFDHIKARGGEGGRSPHSNLVPGLGLIPSDSGHHLLRGVLATNRTPERLDGSLRFLDKFEIRRDSLGRPL